MKIVIIAEVADVHTEEREYATPRITAGYEEDITTALMDGLGMTEVEIRSAPAKLWRQGGKTSENVYEQRGSEPDRRPLSEGGDRPVTMFRRVEDAWLAVNAVNTFWSGR